MLVLPESAALGGTHGQCSRAVHRPGHHTGAGEHFTRHRLTVDIAPNSVAVPDSSSPSTGTVSPGNTMSTSPSCTCSTGTVSKRCGGDSHAKPHTPGKTNRPYRQQTHAQAG